MTETTPLLATPSVNSQTRFLDDGLDPSKSSQSREEQAPRHSQWRTEIRPLLSSSLPLVGTYLLQYFYNLIIILFVSHLGTQALAAVSLAITTMNIIGFAIFEGMATALDTLCAQSYGSGNPKLVGLHVQRMVLLLLLVSVPVGAVWIFSPWWLAKVVPQKELAAMAGAFLRVSLVGVPGYAVFEAGKRFVQAQGNFRAGLVVLILCAPVNLGLNWLLVFVRLFSLALRCCAWWLTDRRSLQYLDLGILGAALAAALTNTVRPGLLILYIHLFAPDTLRCWPGFTTAAFKNWGSMMSLSFSSALMTLCEWFAFEILSFSTSYLSIAHLAAHTFLNTACILTWHIPFSVSVVMSTRLGQLIGAGTTDAARRACKTYSVIAFAIGVLDMAIVLVLLLGIINPLFILDPTVRLHVLRSVPLLVLFQLFDALNCCVTGVVRGLGRQTIGGWVTFAVNYLLAVPLAVWLELGSPGIGLRGIWAGTGLGQLMIAVILGTILSRMDWEICVEEARRREEVVEED